MQTAVSVDGRKRMAELALPQPLLLTGPSDNDIRHRTLVPGEQSDEHEPVHVLRLFLQSVLGIQRTSRSSGTSAARLVAEVAA